MLNQPSSPWEFRVRAWIAFAIYFFGFFVGYAIDRAMGGTGTPSYLLLGTRWGEAGVRGAATLVAALTLLGFLLRWWGSSYHGAGIVYSGRIETATLTAAGPYRYMRNPLYLGNLLQAVGIGSLGPPAATVTILVLLTAFIYRLIFLEETQLRAAQGDAYARYCAAVPRLIPRLRSPTIPSSGQSANIKFGLITELGSLGFAVWVAYIPIANPQGPTPTFIMLFYIAILLFIIGGVANRRMTRASETRKNTP